METFFPYRCLRLLSACSAFLIFTSGTARAYSTNITDIDLSIPWTTGNGGWNTSIMNPWSSSNGASYIAQFTNGSGSVTVSGTNYLNGINWAVFSSTATNFTISGGALVFAGTNSSIYTPSALTNPILSIASAVYLTNTLTQSGYGSIRLSGLNNFTNGTWIQSGSGSLIVAGTNSGGSYQIGGSAMRSALVVSSTGQITNASIALNNNGTAYYYNTNNALGTNSAKFGSATLTMAGGTLYYSASGSTNTTANIGGLSLDAGQGSFLTTIGGSAGTNVLNIGTIAVGTNASLQTSLQNATSSLGRVQITNTNGLNLINGILPWAFDTSSGSFLTYATTTNLIRSFPALYATNN